MSLFPHDDKARKMLVLFKYLTRYFPKAHREVTKVCVVNNVRYNPECDPNDIHWARGKSPDQLGSAFRHMTEYEVDGKVFEEVPPDIAQITGIDRVYTLAEAMWRIGAQLELEIEKQESKVPGHPISKAIGPLTAKWPPLGKEPEWEYICGASKCRGHEVGTGFCSERGDQSDTPRGFRLR